MNAEDLVAANEFCIHHDIELSFIYSLDQSGLIQTITIEENLFLPVSELTQLEKLVRLHYELDINLEGIETITYLLKRLGEAQQQLDTLTNRLKIFENE